MVTCSFGLSNDYDRKEGDNDQTRQNIRWITRNHKYFFFLNFTHLSARKKRSLSVDFLLSNTKILQGESGSEVIVMMVMIHMWQSTDFFGVTLVCGDDRQIDVHKAILPAVRPVMVIYWRWWGNRWWWWSYDFISMSMSLPSLPRKYHQRHWIWI